jgi:hypothetical protein
MGPPTSPGGPSNANFPESGFLNFSEPDFVRPDCGFSALL